MIRDVLVLTLLGLALVASGCTAALDTGSLNTGDAGSIADSNTPDGSAPDSARLPAKINVQPTSSLSTSEGGGSASFDVWLDSAPNATVVIKVESDNPAEGTVDKDELVFEPSNFNFKQRVTVTGKNDDIADGPQLYTVILSPASSQDELYNGVDPEDVQVTNSDDETPGVRIVGTTLTTSEGPGEQHEATFDVELNTHPNANVLITFTSGNPAEGVFVTGGSTTGESITLTFTPENFNTAQTVTVRGVDDDIVDGDAAYTISSSASSEDPFYDATNETLDLADLSVTNLDDDSAAVELTNASGLKTNEGGGSASFNVKLSSKPMALVVVDIAVVGDEGSRSVPSDGKLRFTANGNEWQDGLAVTVVGQDDDVVDGPQTFDVTIAVDQSETQDATYKGLTSLPGPVHVTNEDNDAPAVIYEDVDLQATEGAGTAQINVSLTKQPNANVMIDIAATQNAAEASITQPSGSTKQLTFTPSNFATPQPVVVTAVDDDVMDGTKNYELQFTASGALGYDGLPAATRIISIVDDDTADFDVVGGPLTTGTNGMEDSFTVVLTSEPTANVLVTVTLDGANGAGQIDGAAGDGSEATLTFTAANWDTPQTVTVVGLDNDGDTGTTQPDQTYNVTFAVENTSAAEYRDVTIASIGVTHVDNDAN